jgi:hypothetical protein
MLITNQHRSIDLLEPFERAYLERAIRLITHDRRAESWKGDREIPRLAGDDRLRQFEDALARWIIESRH